MIHWELSLSVSAVMIVFENKILLAGVLLRLKCCAVLCEFIAVASHIRFSISAGALVPNEMRPVRSPHQFRTNQIHHPTFP